MDYAGVAALVVAISHAIFTTIRLIKRAAKDSAAAEAHFIETLANAATQSIETSKAMLTNLAARLDAVEADNMLQRKEIAELQGIIAALKADNHRLRIQIANLQQENKVLRERLGQVEKQNGN